MGPAQLRHLGEQVQVGRAGQRVGSQRDRHALGEGDGDLLGLDLHFGLPERDPHDGLDDGHALGEELEVLRLVGCAEHVRVGRIGLFGAGRVGQAAALEELRDALLLRDDTSSILVDAGLLRKMTLKGRTVFEHDYGYPSHDHLHCEVCNQLIEFRSQAMENLRDKVAREHDFQVISHRMFVTGICSACRQRKSAEG